MKRFLSAITALIILTLSLTSLFGCAKSTSLLKIDPTEDEKRVVGRIGDFDVYYDELRYITLTYKEQMENKYGEGIWKDAQSAAPYVDELSKKVYESITANYGALMLAKENGISVDDGPVQDYCHVQMEDMASKITLMLMSSHEEENKKNDAADTGDSEDGADEDKKSDYGEDYTPTNAEVNKAYREQLKAWYLTDRYVRFVFAVDGCIEQLVIKYEKDGILFSADEDIERYIKSNFCRTLHIFVRNDDGENVDDNRVIAETVLSELEGGKSFNSMVGSKYNDDLMTTSVNGHYFGKGEMQPEYEAAAYELGIDEHSGIVETADGFYIIKRLKLEDHYINSYFEELKTQYRYAVVNSDISETRKGLSLVLNDFGASLELWSIK